MKVKLKKRQGFYQLVVDDKDINKKYKCTQKDPIVLAVLDSWEGTKCWSLRDLRLCDPLLPSPYLEGSGMQFLVVHNQEQESWLTSCLKRYEKSITPEGQVKINWNDFDGMVAFGDKSNNEANPEYVKRCMTGAWSFEKGMEQFSAIRQFWENFTGEDLENTKLENIHKQPNRIYFSGLIHLLEASLPLKKELFKSWHTAHGLSEKYQVPESLINSGALEESHKKPKIK